MNLQSAKRLALLKAAAQLLILINKRLRRRPRRYGVRPLFRKRIEKGDGSNLVHEMRFDPAMFFNYTRLSYERFEYLLSLVGPILKRKKKMRTVILPHQCLAMTLRFLAIGDSQASLSFSYRCGRSTVSMVLRRTLRAIVTVLHEKNVVRVPSTPEEWKEIAAQFWETCHLPHCLGAIDGKHVQIQCPKASVSLFFNYKKTYSTVLMAVAGADYTFIAADVGAEGSLHDSAIFRDTKFAHKMETGKLNVPPPTVLPNSTDEMDYFFAGDGAFQLRKDLLKPYATRKLTWEEAIYNFRVCLGRRIVENTFGLLTARWRIFRQPLCCLLDTADLIVMATVCLHNFIIKTRGTVKKQYCPDNFLDKEEADGSITKGHWRLHVQGDEGALRQIPATQKRNCPKSATEARLLLTSYFNNEGAVPWQRDRIRKGFWGAHVTDENMGSDDSAESDND